MEYMISSSLLGVGVKPWVIGADHDSKMKRTEMWVIRGICGKRKIDSTELRRTGALEGSCGTCRCNERCTLRWRRHVEC